MEIEIKEEMKDKQEKYYEKKRSNYAKANYIAMQEFFNGTDWTKNEGIKVSAREILFLPDDIQTRS